MAYNRYRNGGGTPERVETPPPPPPVDPPPAAAPQPPEHPGPAGPHPSAGALDAALRRLTPEDLLVMAVLYLAYRSSGDWEMLAALGAYFIL